MKRYRVSLELYVNAADDAHAQAVARVLGALVETAAAKDTATKLVQEFASPNVIVASDSVVMINDQGRASE